MKAYNYFTYLISLIFLVTGILILSNIVPMSTYFMGNEMLKYMFGGLLVVYGIFRGVNVYFRSKNKSLKDNERKPFI